MEENPVEKLIREIRVSWQRDRLRAETKLEWLNKQKNLSILDRSLSLNEINNQINECKLLLNSIEKELQ